MFGLSYLHKFLRRSTVQDHRSFLQYEWSYSGNTPVLVVVNRAGVRKVKAIANMILDDNGFIKYHVRYEKQSTKPLHKE